MSNPYIQPLSLNLKNSPHPFRDHQFPVLPWLHLVGIRFIFALFGIPQDFSFWDAVTLRATREASKPWPSLLRARRWGRDLRRGSRPQKKKALGIPKKGKIGWTALGISGRECAPRDSKKGRAVPSGIPSMDC